MSFQWTKPGRSFDTCWKKISEKNTGQNAGAKNLDEHNAELKRKDLLQDRQPFKRKSNIFVMRLIRLLHRQHHKKSFPDCCLIDIILHLKSVVADTATCILIVKIHHRKNLGTLYEETHLLQIFQENSNRQSSEKSHPADRIITDFQNCQNCLFLTKLTKLHTLSFYKIWFTTCNRFAALYQGTAKSGIRTKVKLSNLKMMAQTVTYIQEHGFQGKEDLDAALSNASAQSTDTRNTLKSTEDALKI